MTFLNKYTLLTITTLLLTSHIHAAAACASGSGGASSADAATESLTAAPSRAVRSMEKLAPFIDPRMTAELLVPSKPFNPKEPKYESVPSTCPEALTLKVASYLHADDRKSLALVSTRTSKARTSLKIKDDVFIAMATAHPDFFATTERLRIAGGICEPLAPAIWPYIDSLGKQLRALFLSTTVADSKNIDRLATIQWARLERLYINLSPLTSEIATAIIASSYLWKNLVNLEVCQSNSSGSIDGYKLLWNHILTVKDLKLDKESKAFAHMELANTGETPEDHYRAILELGLKADHPMVRHAHTKLYGNAGARPAKSSWPLAIAGVKIRF